MSFVRQRYEHHNLVLESDGQSRMRERTWERPEEPWHERVRRTKAGTLGRGLLGPIETPNRTAPSGPYSDIRSYLTYYRTPANNARGYHRESEAWSWDDAMYHPELYEGEA